MRVIAIPNPAHPPSPRALRPPRGVLDSIAELTPDVIEEAGYAAGKRAAHGSR